MNTKNPIKNYLIQSVRTNGKIVLLALFALLVVWVAVAILRTVPAVTDVISERLLREFIVDLPVKFVVALLPYIILMRTESYSKWTKANPDTPITKKDFTTATYLNHFLLSLTSMPVLAVIWTVAVLADPYMLEYIPMGIYNAGAMFFVVWAMAGLNYTLQFMTYFQKSKEKKLTLAISFIISFGIAFGLQSLFYSVFELPRMATLAAIIIAAIGLVVFLICRPITARLYEKQGLL
ncbi:MAG: ABC-2 transporter permease [Defluviitaleaceae bacterium]|nr:ABC-2 transporter permease [Defluviitaleaceae bacterium]